MIKFLACKIILIALAINVASAQDSLYKRLSIGVDLSYGFNLMGGDMRRSTDNLIKEYESLGDENDSYKAGKGVKSSPFITLFASYMISKKCSASSGIRIGERGYKIKLRGEEKNNDFQIDDIYTFQESFSLTVIELPFSLAYRFNNQIMLTGGVSLGLPVKKSAILTYRISHENKINGNTVVDETEEYKINAQQHSRSIYAGLFVGADYKVFNNFYAGVYLNQTSGYARFNGGGLNDFGILLSVKYLLPIK